MHVVLHRPRNVYPSIFDVNGAVPDAWSPWFGVTLAGVWFRILIRLNHHPSMRHLQEVVNMRIPTALLYRFSSTVKVTG